MTRLVRIRPVAAMIFIAVIQVGTILASQSSQAKTFTILDRTFVRATGAPVTEVVNLAASPGTYDLRIESIGTASAVITVNGTEVASPRDFNSGSTTLLRSVSLLATNKLTVELRGAPSGRIRLLITGVDLDRPAITATMSPALNAFGWSALPVRVTFVCTDSGSGIASCTAPVLVNAEGANQPVTGTAIDRVGNTSSTTVSVSVDRTAPRITPLVSPPPNVLGWNRTNVTVSFSCADDLSGVQECSAPATVSVPGHEGANELQGIVVDRAGNRANRSVIVNIDSTAPTIVGTPERPPDVDGWYLGPVVISFACNDDRSGVAICPEPVRVATMGSGIIVPGTAVDRAGNSGSTSFALNMRSPSAPGLTADVTPPPNAAGWNNSPVTVVFACQDAGAGIQTCPVPQSFDVDGVHEVTATATDPFGTSRTITLTVRVDRTAPQISAAVNPAPNDAGWHRAPATVQFACSDALSGIATCPVATVVSTDGPGQIVAATAVDQAGNTALVSASINLDSAPPSIRAILSAPGGVANGDVVVTFECSDALSGLADCPAPVTISAEGLNQAISGTAHDRAGNSATATVSVSLDRTRPTIVASVFPSPNGAGWNNTPVTVTFTCTDTGSSIVSCPQPQTLSTDGAGQVVTGEAVDAAGNRAEASVTLNIDTTGPVVVLTPSAAANVAGWHQASLTVAVECQDSLSTIASCTPAIPVTTDGVHTLNATAVDVAGNATSVSLVVRLDTIAPGLVAAIAPPANAAGWHNTDVDVAYTCEDAGSGVDVCAPARHITLEGANQILTATIVDIAGNVATVSTTLNVDKTAPQILPVAAPPANANGWNNTPVTVAFTCSDALSDLASCTTPVTVASEVVNQVITGTAVDRAGNRADATVTLNIDITPPTLQPHSSATGWTNQNVNVSFDCSDGQAGIASCPAAEVFSQEGRSSISREVTDRAGNTASSSVEISIDRTPPTITVLVTPPLDGGYARAPVTVSFNCADSGSGIADCPAARVVSVEGLNQEIAGTARDTAGNATDASVIINLDLTPPTVRAIATPAPNAAGWNNTAVTVRFECEDTAGAVAVCPSPVTVSSEGAAQVVHGEAVDGAGHRATATITLNLDFTAPQISAAVQPPANPFGWHAQSAIVSFTCSDALSDIASCTPPVTAAGGAGQQITGTAIDQAGNVATASQLVNVDGSAPSVVTTLTPQPNAAGWNNSDVTVSFSCTDSGAGIVECPAAFTVSTEGANQAFTRNVLDRAGNTAVVSTRINLDRTAPTINVTSPADGTVLRATQVHVTATLSDALSGIATVYCGNSPIAGTTALDCLRPLVPGANTILVRAVDVAGNETTSTRTVQVEGNREPRAVPGGPYNGVTGTPVSFTGASSFDPDGQTLTYAWRFGDNTTGTGPQPTHVYANAGTFTVVLTVDDGNGSTNEASATVTVTRANAVPTAHAGGPYVVDVDQQLILDASTSTDADGDSLSASWAFGEGGIATGLTPRYTYRAAGTFTATVTITDGRGGSATATAQVTVRAANRLPVASVGGPYRGEVSRAIAFDASASTDPDGDAITFEWTFGDGGAASGVSATHTFATTGTFPVTVTVTDARGGSSSASAQVTVTATNATPIAEANGPYAQEVGFPITFSSAGSQDPDGDVLTYTWRFGDGRVNTGSSPSSAYSTPGTYTVELTVNDGRGGTAVDTATVTITPRASEANRNPVANAGGPYQVESGVPLILDPAGSTDPDGDTLTFAWNFGDGGSSNERSPHYAFANAGGFSVTLTVSDGRGGSAVATAVVTVSTATDRAPPLVTLRGPAQVLPGSEVVVSAQVADASPIASVTFAIVGSDSTTDTEAPYERSTTVPAVGSPGQTIIVTATATDAGGNVGSGEFVMTIAAQPDSTPPTVTLNHPAQAAAGASIRFSAEASDTSGIRQVTFLVNDQAVGVDGEPPFEATYVVAADAALGSVLRIAARAADFSGNEAEASGDVAVSAVADIEPPTLALQAPANAVPGATVHIVATPSDNVGIAKVQLRINGVPATELTTSPFELDVPVAATAPLGSLIRVDAVATDFAGLEGAANATVRITSVLSEGEGLLLGEVYDDRLGVPLAGAHIRLTGIASGAPFTIEATSDARGAYAMRVAASAGTLTISRDGWTTVIRSVTVPAGQVVTAIDARLTHYDAAQNISPTLGGTLTSGAAQVRFASGAVTEPRAFQAKRLTAQGLRGLLPLGWSPLDAIDILPANQAFASPAEFDVPAPTDLASGRLLHLVTWDDAAGAWRVLASQPQPAAATLTAPISGTGQFVWVIADAAPTAPPLPADGELLPGAAASPLPSDALANLTPQPRVLVYEPGSSSRVLTEVPSTQPLVSGTHLQATVQETYHFNDDATVRLDAMVQDLFFHQHPANAQSLRADYAVSPSISFEPGTLRDGVITIDVHEPAAVDANVVTAGGGSALGDGGTRLDIPSGAVSALASASVQVLTEAGLGMTLPPGVTFIGGATVSLSEALGRSALLSIARPTSINDNDSLLLVRVTEIGGASRLVLVGLGRPVADRITTVLELPRNGVAMSGVRQAGRYAFLKVDAAAFVFGHVLGVTSTAFANALITCDTLGIAALSGADGGYVAAIRPVASNVTALDVVHNDLGSARVTPAGAGDELALDLRLRTEPPRIISITPSNNAANVAPTTAVFVRFSEPIDPSSIASGLVLSGPGGATVDGGLALSDNNTLLTLRPSSELATNTEYTVRISGVRDLAGNALTAPFTTRFTSLDTIAPLPPLAGALRASIPEAGFTTVTGTQGTAGAHDTVFIENITRGTFTPVLLDPNGGFQVRIAVGLADKLRLRITDQGGNETQVNLPRFSDGQGRVVVGPDGGTIDGPNDLKLEVAPGTFPQGSIVRVIAQTQAEIGVASTPDYPFLAGFGIESSAEPQTYLNVSLPVPPGTPEGDTGIIAQVVNVFGGHPALSVVDSAIVENGRLHTSSLPCPGILTSKFTRYSAYLSPLGKRRLAVSLLNLAVPRTANIVLQPYLTQPNPFMPVPTVVHPGFTFTERVYPQSPYVSAILENRVKTEDLAKMFATLEGGVVTPTGEVCDPISGFCTANTERVCMVVPADQDITIVVRSAATGNVITQQQITTPPANTSLTVTRLYVAPGDTRAPGLVEASWGPTTPHIIDPNEPIRLRFSEAISFTAVTTGQPMFIEEVATGRQIQFSRIAILENARKLELRPASTLQMGRTYRIRTPGLTDLVGNPFTDVLEFQTFKPTILRETTGFFFDRDDIKLDLTGTFNTPAFEPSLLGGVGLRDLSFSTRTPDESLDRRWHTTITGVRGGFQTQYKLFTFDLDNPGDPQAKNAVVIGNRSMVTTLSLPAISFKPRVTTLVPPIPLPADMTAALASWNDRRLYTVTGNAGSRMCARPFDPDLPEWLQRQADAGLTVTTSTNGCGDLALSASYNTLFATLDIWDVTDRNQPTLVGHRVMNDNGASLSPPPPKRSWAPEGVAVAKSLMVMPLDITHEFDGVTSQNLDTFGVFSSLNLLGLGMVDLQRNVPPIFDFAERKGTIPTGTLIDTEATWIFPYYQGISALSGRVIAIAADGTDGTGTTHLEVFTPQLTPIGQPFPLIGIRPTSLWTGAGFLQYDSTGDGVPDPHDAAIVSGLLGGVAVIEINQAGVPTLRGYLRTDRTPPTAGGSASGLGDLQIVGLGHLDVDTEQKVGYVKARWRTPGSFDDSQGLLALDLSAPFGGPSDEDGDGWDDRLLGLIPLFGPFQPFAKGEVNRFRIDQARKLIYVATEQSPDDNLPFLIVQMCKCSDLLAKVDLRSAGVGASEFPSNDNLITTVYVSAPDYAAGQVRVSVNVEPYVGNTVTYKITEIPFSGNATDRVLDPTWSATGTVFGGSSQINVPLAPRPANQPLPPGSLLAIDFTDSSGNFIKRLNVEVVTLQVVAPNVVVRTRLDKTNARILETQAFLNFYLAMDAKVTVRVDSQVLSRDAAGAGIPPFTNIALPAGWNRIAMSRRIVPEPGTHTFQITATFEANAVAVAQGEILHDVVITESLPIGQTFVKGVSLQDGHLGLSRDDIGIPGVGPALSFSRTYSSSGVRSSGPMGANWSHNWQSTLSVDDTGTVTVSAGDGGGGRFTQFASGPSTPGVTRFKPDAGYHGTVEFSNNAYDFYSKVRYRYHFEKPAGDPNSDYLLQWVEDANGNRLTLAYVNDTQLHSVTDAAGRTLTFTYGDHGVSPEPRIERVEGPMNLLVEFGYDEFGNLTSATRGSRTESYDYSITSETDRHNLLRATDPNGNATAYTYFAQADVFPGESTPPFDMTRDVLVIPQKNELVKVVTEGEASPVAAATTFAFDYSNHATRYVTTVTDARSHDTIYTMNPRGNVTEQRTHTPDGDNVTLSRWAYEDGINDVYVTKKTDPNGRVTSYVYDANGNMTSETIDTSTVSYAGVSNAAGASATNVVTAYTFDQKFNQVLTKTDPEGNVTTYTYDPANGNLLTTTTDPLDGSGPHVITYGYTTHTTPGGTVLKGLLTTVRDPLQRLTRYEQFDQWGNATQTIDALNNVTTNTFDARGRVASSSDTRGRHVTTSYDELDRVLSKTTFAGVQPAAGRPSADRVETQTYFPGGQPETVEDGEGHVTTFTYDALNRPSTQTITVADAAGTTQTLTSQSHYDGNGNRSSEIDRRGIERTMGYDVLNRLRTVSVTGVGQVQEFTYDAAGNKLTESDIHNHTTTYEYDGLYRVARTVLPETPYTLRGRYDLNGQVLESWDAKGAHQAKTFDGEFRVKSETNGLGDVTTFGYDAIGNRTLVTDTETGMTIVTVYDDVNRPTSTTTQFPDPITGQQKTLATSRAYDDAAHTVRITDGRGSDLLEKYNGQDEVIASTVDPDGLALTTTYRYDGNGNLTDTIDPLNGDVDVLTEYDALNRPILMTKPLRGTAQTFYDGNSNVVRQVDGRGVAQRFVYDDLNRKTDTILVESISNGGAELTMQHTDYLDAANRTVQTDASGAATTIQHDAMHRDTLITNDQLGTIVREWDGIERRAEIDLRGYRVEYDYDAIGRLTEKREIGGPAVTRMTTTYDDATGRRVDTDRRGIRTVTISDPQGRARRVSRIHTALAAEYGAQEVTLDEWEYDGAGLLVDHRGPRGNVDHYTYDTANRRASETAAFGSPEAAATNFTYDAASNLLTVKDARQHGGAADVTNTYDAANRRVTETNGAGETTTYDFDEADRVVRLTQPAGATFTTAYSYDEVGLLIAVDELRGGTGGVTRSVYDERRNKIAVLDASGRLTTYRYDSLSRLTDEFRQAQSAPLPSGRGGNLGPAGGNGVPHTHYEYDAAGNQTALVDPLGQRVDKTYDNLGRLSTKTYSNHAPAVDGSTVYPQLTRTAVEYDPSGNPIRLSETKQLSESSGDVTEVVASDYDHLERLASQTNADNKVVRNRFNIAGDKLQEIDPDNVATTSTYDLRGRVRTVTSTGGTTTYEYYPDSLQRQVTYPNGIVASMTYDRADRIRSVRNENGAGALVSSEQYDYDANGNRRQAIDDQPALGIAAQQTTYAYDALNRLSGVSYSGGGSVVYTYDATGNRLTERGTAETGAAIDRTFSYDGLAQLQLMQDAVNPASSLAFTYDANGNVTRRLTGEIVNGAIGSPTSVQEYVFDIRDRLTRAGAVTGGGSVSFGYDGADRRTSMTTPLFEVRYAYGENDVIQEYSSGGIATQRYTWGNGLVALGAVQPGGGIVNSYYLNNALKSAMNLVDGAGATTQSTELDPWGNVRAQAGTSPNRRTFTGHYSDIETGLIYMGARYYDPTVGRFLGRDAAVGVENDPISASKYIYANANPLSFIDPTGNAAETVSRPGASGAPAQGSSTGADEPDLSKAGTLELLGAWAVGVGKGAAKAVGAPIAGLLKSGFLGLADIGQAGLGYLAISANPKYVDEIGGFLTPVSDIGKASAEMYEKTGNSVVGGALVAVGESAIGFVKGSVESVKTLPARLKAAANSGDPEQVGAAAVEVIQVGQQIRGPANAIVRKTQQAAITIDILARQRIAKEGVIGSLKEVNGTITPRDAWKVAGVCFEPGSTGCSFVGGFSKRSFANLKENLRAGESLGHGPIETKQIPDGKGGMKFEAKAHGDIDMIVNKTGQPLMNDWRLAKATNAKTSVPFLDTYEGHGVLGQNLPRKMIPADVVQKWWTQQGLPFGSPIRAFDYWTKGVAGVVEGRNVAPLLKGGGLVKRELAEGAFEYRNLQTGGGPPRPGMDRLRFMLVEDSRNGKK